MNKQRESIHSVLESEINKMKKLEDKRNNIVFELSYLKEPFFVKYAIKPKGSELGVFALEDIKAGEVVSFLPIKFIPNSVQKISLEISPNHFVNWHRDIHSCGYLTSYGHFNICSLIGDFINHSCYPDCNTVSNFQCFLDQKIFVEKIIAISNIKANQEILIDYDSLTYTDLPMNCLCNSKQCRKEIKGFKYLQKELQKEFLKNKLLVIPLAVQIYSNLPKNERKDFALSYKSNLSLDEKVLFEILIKDYSIF